MINLPIVYDTNSGSSDFKWTQPHSFQTKLEPKTRHQKRPSHNATVMMLASDNGWTQNRNKVVEGEGGKGGCSPLGAWASEQDPNKDWEKMIERY